MRIAQHSIQDVNSALDAIALVSDHLHLEKRGNRYWGCCPFHSEKTPSFTVDPEKKLYYCFGCHKGGTIIDFFMEMEKVSFQEAIESLAKRNGVTLSYEGNAAPERSRKDDLYELHNRVSGSLHYILMEKPEGKEALAYIRGRGFSEETIRRFALGYAPKNRAWLYPFLSSKGYSPELLAASGLFLKDSLQTSFFYNRLMFPIRDRQARTIGYGARLLDGTGPKYINSSDSELYKKGQTLYGLDLALPEIRRTREVIIVEGYMDVLALHQAGVCNSVAPLGTAFTDEQAKSLRNWADRLYLMFDADEAGQRAAYAAILTAVKNSFDCYVIVPMGTPQGAGWNKAGDSTEIYKDPADILKEAGPEALKSTVKFSIIDFEYITSRGKAQFNLSSVEGKEKAVAYTFPYIEAVASEIRRDSCIGELADIFGIERRAILQDYEQWEGSRKKAIPRNPPQAAQIKPTDELLLLAALIVNYSNFPTLRSMLSIEELESSQAKELYIALEEWYRNGALGMGETAIPPDLITRIESETLRKFILEQGASNAFSSNPVLYIEESVKRVKQKGLERRQNAIIIELRTQRGQERPKNLEDLLVEKMHIDAELRRLKEA